MAAAHEFGDASVLRRRIHGAWALVLLPVLGLGCGSPQVEEPQPSRETLFELDGRDLVIEIAAPDGTVTHRSRVRHLPATADGSLYLETDEALRVAGDGITIGDLQALAHHAPRSERHTELLLKIFNEYGVSMSYLPRGFSAGLAAALDFSDELDASDALEALTGRAWYGKYFERPEECSRVTRGANRIAKNLRVDFVARLIPQHLIGSYVENPEELDIRARSNYVDLNYKSPLPGKRRTGLDEPNSHESDPLLNPLAAAVKRLGVYDLCVVVPGRNGPIVVGRTWFGEYADNAEQTYSASRLDGKQIAWFFLDFNEAAIEEQDSVLNRVEYTPKSSCERRSPETEDLPLPIPRPL